MPSFSCTVEKTIPPGLRLDRYAAEYLNILSRSQIKARKLKASLDGKEVKVSRILKGGEHLELSWLEADIPFLIPQDLPLDVIYEDKRVIVLNKAQGMIVHPGAGNRQGTLANALLYRFLHEKSPGDNFALEKQSDFPGAALRPGIVHRLDKDTSGLIITTRDDEAHAFLAGQFRARKVRKTYAAIVRGCPACKSGFIDKRIIRSKKDRKTFTVSDKEGRISLTYYRLVKTYGNYSLLLLRPKTGRTHQIRVHLKYLGLPILGDPIYGIKESAFPNASLMLHAKRLSLVLPDNNEPTTFRTPLPERFMEIFKAMRKN